jgi:hypothetical protein
MSSDDYRAQELRKAEARRLTVVAVVLFCVSACGIVAPLTLCGSGVWIVRRLRQGGRAASAAELLLYGSGALSLAYTILMVFIFGFGW